MYLHTLKNTLNTQSLSTCYGSDAIGIGRTANMSTGSVFLSLLESQQNQQTIVT